MTAGDWLYSFTLSPALGGVTALGAAILAYRGVKKSVTATSESTRRSEAWKRIEWGLSNAASDDQQRVTAGLSVLIAMRRAQSVTDEDLELLEEAVSALVEDDQAEGDIDRYQGDNCSEEEDAHD